MQSGVLLIDKDAGMTSHDVVSKVRKILNFKKVGHAGTLDPMATGLLVLLIGEATKLSNYLMSTEKKYDLSVKLGLSTDSFDITGKITSENSCDKLVKDEVLREISALSGSLELVVPEFSAVKIGGQKLYNKVRKDPAFKTNIVKTMVFKDFSDVSWTSDLDFRINYIASKGSYVRSWVNTLGQKLGVGACLSSLRRLTSGSFFVGAAVNLEHLAEEYKTKNINDLSAFIPLEKCLILWPSYRVDSFDEKLIRNGVLPKKIKSIFMNYLPMSELDGIRVLSKKNGALVAILGGHEHKGLKINRVFQGDIDPLNGNG